MTDPLDVLAAIIQPATYASHLVRTWCRDLHPRERLPDPTVETDLDETGLAIVSVSLVWVGPGRVFRLTLLDRSRAHWTISGLGDGRGPASGTSIVDGVAALRAMLAGKGKS